MPQYFGGIWERLWGKSTEPDHTQTGRGGGGQGEKTEGERTRE